LKEGSHYKKMESIKARCRSCGKELTGTSKVQSCGCPNQMMVVDDKIGAVDLGQVVMLNSYSSKKETILTHEDVQWQEERRQRKVRKLDFEVR